MAIPAIGLIIKALSATSKVAKVGTFKSLVKGGLTQSSNKLLGKLGFSDPFIRGFNASIEGITRMSKGDLIGAFKTYAKQEKAIERYLKATNRYNKLIDEKAIDRFVRGENVDKIVRIVDEKMPLTTKEINLATKKFNFRSQNLNPSTTKIIRGFIQHFKAQGYNTVCEVLEKLLETKGKKRILVNESIRSGYLQEILKEYYDEEDERGIGAEATILQLLLAYFTDNNATDLYMAVSENRKLKKMLSKNKKIEIISKVRNRTPQEAAKEHATKRKRRRKRRK